LAIPVALGGGFTRAEALLRDALNRLRHQSERDLEREMSVVNNLSSVLERRGDDVGALDLVRETMGLAELLAVERGTSLVHPGHVNRLAKIYRRLGESEEAERCARRAIELHQDTTFAPHSYDLAVAHLVLGETLADRGECEGALDALRLGSELCETIKGADHPETGRFLETRARTLLACGRVDEAEVSARAALAIHERSVSSRHALTCRSLLTLGLALEARGATAAAESVLERAAVAFDAARLGSVEAERALLPLASPYEGLARVRRKLGSESAWIACERAHARSLVDCWIAETRDETSGRDRGPDQELERRMHDLEVAHRELAAAGAGDSLRVRKLRAELASVEAEWAERRAERASVGGRIDAATISLADVQATLNDHTALIGWLDGAVGDSAGWAYVIRASGPVRWSRTGAAGGRSGEKGLRIAIADASEWPARVPWSADVAEAAAALWNERLAPVMSDLESVDRVIVIPSGSMLGIPLEAALGPDGRFAGERFAVSYAPSATVYRMLVERGVRRATTEDDGALLVGDPIFARDGKPADAAPFDRVTWRSALAGNADALDHLPPLPGSRFEVLRLAALLPHPRVLLGAAASESALVELARSGQLSRFRILHVASHALVDDRAPDRSAVVLSRVGLPDALAAALRGERAYDGLWTAKEIVRECRLDADLVTLSGCRTGLGRVAPG
jgi:tetratricopeptide (TPR) repeat protein